jgi:hypothetical protein
MNKLIWLFTVLVVLTLVGAARAQSDLTSENLMHNAINPLDVDANGLVSPRDLLLVLVKLDDLHPSGPPLISPLATAATPEPTFFWDTNNDGIVSPMDALLVIDHLSVAPEPSSIISATMGLAFLAAYAWRRKRLKALVR